VAGLETRKLKGILTLTLVLASLIILPTTVFKTTNAQGWLTGWEYRRAVTINNTANPNTLTDYQVLVVVDTASLISAGKMRSDCGDIRFTDKDGETLLSYWIESGCNTTSTRIWVKVSSIPASSIETIYLYYGNPTASSMSNVDATFLLFDDFSGTSLNTSKWTWFYVAGNNDCYKSSVTVSDGLLTIESQTDDRTSPFCHLAVQSLVKFNYPVIIQTRLYAPNWGGLGSAGLYRSVWYGFLNDTSTAETNTRVHVIYDENGRKLIARTAGTESSSSDYTALNPTVFHNSTIIWVPGSKALWYVNGVLVASLTTNVPPSTYSLPIEFRTNHWGTSTYPSGKLVIDYVIVRKYTEPEPATSVSATEETPIMAELPNTSVIFRHMLVYSPNSTVFTHSFTATNTSTAGYETSYGGDTWAWRVYANPYTDPTTGLLTLENTASLVSNITITLPYATMLIEKLELYAKTNGTGNYRQLWVKILDSAGSLVAEVSNATMGTNWALTTMSVNSLLSDNVTIWINATVTSTTSVGEEICVAGVKLYMSYNTTTRTLVYKGTGDYLNATTVFTVSLNATLTNTSIIDLLVIDKLTYTATNYPVTPGYVGNETVNSNNYLVYRIAGATSTGTYNVYSTIPNAITKITFKSKGVEVTRVLVGEPVTVEIPVTGNISIPDLVLEYINTSSITIAFNKTGAYIIMANATRSVEYIIGYRSTTIVVDYGAFTANFNDVDGKPVDYETLDLTLVNKYTGESRSLKTKVSTYFTGLKPGVHELTARFKGIPVCYGTLDLYSATNASALNLTCMLKRVLDYRGLNRSLIFELGKQLVSFEDLSLKYPYSRSRVLLNGTGAFTLILDYYGKKPTSVGVAGNVTITRWYWDGYYLVVTGTLGSVGEVNITDLYKLRVEVYDRLGNLIPFNVPLYINDTAYYTPVAEGLFYPETYNITFPAEIYGFKFHSFSDGYTDTVRLVDVSTSDVVLKAYYRVPSKVEVGAYRVSTLIEAIKRLFNLGENEYVSVFFEGRLLDYYGGGVPGRTITVRLYRAGSLVAEYNVTTDQTGYWRTPIVQLLRGETYTVSVYYAGDDTYVESGAVYEFTSEAPPTPPAVTAPPLEILVLATGALLLVGLALAITHAVRHVAVEIREKEARFVKKKQS
jgi:hypothetical protein